MRERWSFGWAAVAAWVACGVTNVPMATAQRVEASAANRVDESAAARGVVVDVAPGALERRPGLSAEALRAAVSDELGVPAVRRDEPAASRARGTLSIAVDAGHRLIITYRDQSGRELWRSIAVPDDPVGAVGTIAMLAGNLARDEAADLLGPVNPSSVVPSEPVGTAQPLAVDAPPIVVLPPAATGTVVLQPPAATGTALVGVPATPLAPAEPSPSPPDDALEVFMLGGPSMTSRGTWVQGAVAGVYRVGSWALGGELSHSAGIRGNTAPYDATILPVGRDWNDESATRTSITAIVERAATVGRLRLGVGGGVSAMIYAQGRQSDLRPGLQAFMRAGYALTASFGLAAQLTASSALGSFESDVTRDGAWQLALGVGAFLRL